jgi:hypothetical protein
MEGWNTILIQKITRFYSARCLWISAETYQLGASVAKWLRFLTSNHLPLTAVGSDPTGTLNSFMWGSYPASLWNASLVLIRCQFVLEIMHGGGSWGLPSPVNMTYNRFVRLKTEQKKNINFFVDCIILESTYMYTVLLREYTWEITYYKTI